MCIYVPLISIILTYTYLFNARIDDGMQLTLQWRYNDHNGFSNHQPHGCLLNRLFRRRSKKTSKLRVTDLCVGNSPGPVNSMQKGSVTRKMFPFDDVIMSNKIPAFHVKRTLGMSILAIFYSLQRIWLSLLSFFNRFKYMNNNVTKCKCFIRMNTSNMLYMHSE